MKYCERCGAPADPNGKFCPKCGRRYGASAVGSFFEKIKAMDFRAIAESLDDSLGRATDAMEGWIRKGVDCLTATNYAAPSFIILNILAIFLLSSVCGLIGTFFSWRTIELRRVNSPNAPAASKRAKLWFAFACLFAIFKIPLVLACHSLFALL